MENHASSRQTSRPPEARLRFPENVEYVVGPEAALQAIRKTINEVQGFREKELYFFRDVVGPLLPHWREMMEKLELDHVSFSYRALIRMTGYLTAFATQFGLHKRIDTINQHYRLAVLPFLDLMIKEQIEKLEKQKSIGSRLRTFAYKKLHRSLTSVVDNLMHLIATAWAFNPGIGEPDQTTGFYNRFVFGRRCGFLDLGHFFNCAIIAYLYGAEEAKARGESIELKQRRLRNKAWLQKLHDHRVLENFTALLWGFATSADTIEDRASDWFGIELGMKMRAAANNGKIIDFFIDKWPSVVKGELLGSEKLSWGRRIYEIGQLIFQLIRHRLGTGARFEIAEYMQSFFAEHDAVDPANREEVPPGLLEEVILFYFEKYNSEEWEKYNARNWEVIIPQVLWERVVRDKWAKEDWLKAESELPIKIQLVANGEKVEPYFREE
ncbi:MAG: hypothetical protein ONA90_01050 [candidate division KSB1 bacterium]|nr:hypothetical protein [candidate division KSB1 bacterium]